MHSKTVTPQQLQAQIAASLHSVKAYELPAVCVALGLADGIQEEAYASKRTYVKSRIGHLAMPELVELARKVVERFEDAHLDDLLSELSTPDSHRISDITRRAILAELDQLYPLFGELPPLDGLEILHPEWGMVGPEGTFLHTLHDDIIQHFVANEDYSNSTALKHCGAMTCAQQRFIALIELILSPLCRTDAEQVLLAPKLEHLFSADGFTVALTRHVSRRAVYGVRRRAAGVAGSPKNLIFASINTKPDIYFTDAIDNNLAIQNEHDALIYDRALSGKGLLWSDLVGWWSDLHQATDHDLARKGLYGRLSAAVRETGSVGEAVLFDTYYRTLGPTLQDRLPALIPQVYLHYDPKTSYQRGSDKVLVRERMDFLLLLEHDVRVVIEVDGQHHYAVNGKPSPKLYAQMASEDRQLRLRRYDVYRFGGAEFPDSRMDNGTVRIGDESRTLASSFFNKLFALHGLL